MSVINGFVILVMLLLLAYMSYRLFVRKRLLTLLSLLTQIFALMIAALCFYYDMEALIYIEAVFVLFGILIPCSFFVYDFRLMLKSIKEKGVYEGLVQPEPDRHDESVRISSGSYGINPVHNEIPVSEIIKEVDINNEEILNNIKKSLNLANSCIFKKDYQNAFDIYGSLVRIITNCFSLFYNYGNICYNLGCYSDAALYYSKAAAIENVKAYQAYYNLGNAQFMLGRHQEALQSYRKALELKPGLADADENIVSVLLAMEENQKAIEHLKLIISRNDGNHKAHYNLCRLLSKEGKYAEAEAEAQKCVRLDPEDCDSLNELGRLRARQGKLKEALKAYDDLIRLQPENHNAYYSKATLLYKLGERKEAIRNYRKVLELKPDNYKSYYNMAIAYDELGNKEAAEEAYRKAIEIKPDFVDAYNNLGILLSNTNRLNDAIAVYEAGISKNPEDYSLFLNKGISLYEKGRFVDAVEAFRTALELKPEEKEINYYLGSALMEARLYNEAVETYKNALKVRPEDSEIFYSLATVYSLLGKYDIALDNLKKAFELKVELRNDAKINRAFDGMRNRSAFKELVT